MDNAADFFVSDIADSTLSQFAEMLEKEEQMWAEAENGLDDLTMTQLVNSFTPT